LVLGFIKLFKNSEKYQAHNEPHTDFLEHIAVQIVSFSGSTQDSKPNAFYVFDSTTTLFQGPMADLFNKPM
jgi:hypothetical protein